MCRTRLQTEEHFHRNIHCKYTFPLSIRHRMLAIETIRKDFPTSTRFANTPPLQRSHREERYLVLRAHEERASRVLRKIVHYRQKEAAVANPPTPNPPTPNPPTPNPNRGRTQGRTQEHRDCRVTFERPEGKRKLVRRTIRPNSSPLMTLQHPLHPLLLCTFLHLVTRRDQYRLLV